MVVKMSLGEYTPMDTSDPSTEALATGLNVIGGGLNILRTLFVFLVGGLVGGKLSAVGFVLCAIDLTKAPRPRTIIAPVACFLGPALLAIKFSIFVTTNQSVKLR
jgi:hypothetical protein